MGDNTAKEAKRLEATRRYLNFQFNREKELNSIVMLASMICNTPIALITLMDKDIQFINAKTGADITEMPRSTSFCTHAIEDDEVMEVPDAQEDSRFSDIPVVKHAPNIRFYASANLKSVDGYNVGTLCVYDIQPKNLTLKQKECLSALALQVSHIMELDHALKRLEKQNLALEEIARVQSHELRSPVSSILGLVALFKENGYKNISREYFLLLENASNLLDEKIKLIVSTSNDTKQE